MTDKLRTPFSRFPGLKFSQGDCNKTRRSRQLNDLWRVFWKIFRN